MRSTNDPSITRRLLRASRPRRTWAAPVIAAVVLGLAGCGDTTGRTAPDAAGTAGTDDGAPVTGTAEGAADTEEVGTAVEPVAFYPFGAGFESDVAGAPPLRTVGDVSLVYDDAEGAGAAEFGHGSGLTLDSSVLESRETYTLALRFHLESSDYGWLKLIDLTDGTGDKGFYAHNQKLQFYTYPTHAGEAPLDGPPHATVILRRDADGTISWFVDGEHQADVDDDRADAVVSSETIRFFLDDDEGHGEEQSPGRVAWISVYEDALTDATIADVAEGRVPRRSARGASELSQETGRDDLPGGLRPRRPSQKTPVRAEEPGPHDLRGGLWPR